VPFGLYIITIIIFLVEKYSASVMESWRLVIKHRHRAGGGGGGVEQSHFSGNRYIFLAAESSQK